MRGRLSLLVVAAVGLVCASAVGGCGEDEPGGETEATLVLDFVPGPAHAGIYRAVTQGFYDREGLDLRIIEPTSTADTLKLIDAGAADFGIADGIDLAGQIAAGRDAQGILALTQRPLGGLITLEASGFASPAALSGETVGVTGVPSDDAVLDAIVSGAGGDPTEIETVTIGFNGVPSLQNEKIAAFTGYIPADGVQVEQNGYPTRSFALDEFGGPRYPGLVAFSTRERIGQEPELIERFVSATVAGYRDVIAEPASGVEALVDENPAIPRSFATASVRAYLPFFGRVAGFGRFDPAAVAELTAFMRESDLAPGPIPPGRYATNEFVARAG